MLKFVTDVDMLHSDSFPTLAAEADVYNFPTKWNPTLALLTGP